MVRTSSGETCFACGRPPEGPYCCRCGVKQSETNRRHWSITDQYDRAARTVERKVKYDRRLYGPENLPPASQMIVSAAEAISRPKRDIGERDRPREFFPAIGPQSEHGLWTEKVIEMALSRFESG